MGEKESGVCLFQNDHSGETQRDRERPAVRRPARLLEADSRKTISVCVVSVAKRFRRYLSNCFLSARIETPLKKKDLREASKLFCELEGGEIWLNLRKHYFCENVARQNVSISLSESRGLALVPSFTSNSEPLLESLKGRAV